MTRCDQWEEPVLTPATENSCVLSSFVPLQHSWHTQSECTALPDNLCTGLVRKLRSFLLPGNESLLVLLLIPYCYGLHSKILHSDFKATEILPQLPVKYWAIIWFPCKSALKFQSPTLCRIHQEKGEGRGTRSCSQDLLLSPRAEGTQD